MSAQAIQAILSDCSQNPNNRMENANTQANAQEVRAGGPKQSYASVAAKPKKSLLFSGKKTGTKQNLSHGETSPKPHGQSNRRGQSGGMDREIARAMNEYRNTLWYVRAIEKGFKNEAALLKFNEHVQGRIDTIDPARAPVCEYCGHSELTLCTCLITNKETAVDVAEDGAVLIPAGPNSVSWRFTWVDGIKRMFVRPRFDADKPINHQIGWLSNDSIDEGDMLWPELLAYIRQKQHTTYDINGKRDRAACLAHSKKIAKLFLDEMKVDTKTRLNSNFTNRVHYTVQRATDQRDDEFLFQEQDPDWNVTSYFRRVPWQSLGKYALLAAMLASPRLCLKLASVSMRSALWLWRRFAHANALILVRGSILAFKSMSIVYATTVYALGADIMNGLALPLLTEAQRLSCRTASIMSTEVSRCVTYATQSNLMI